MYVKFEYTEADLVDAAERFLSRSKSFRAMRFKVAVYIVIFFALVVCAAAAFVGYGAAAIAAAFGAYAVGYQQLTHKEDFRRRLRKLVREQYGQFGRGVCEVELTPVGACVRQWNTQVTYEWEVVEEVKVTTNSVDIFTRHGGGVIVRTRAFRDAAEFWRFVEEAEGYLELSRAGSVASLGGAEGEEVGGELEHGR